MSTKLTLPWFRNDPKDATSQAEAKEIWDDAFHALDISEHEQQEGAARIRASLEMLAQKHYETVQHTHGKEALVSNARAYFIGLLDQACELRGTVGEIHDYIVFGGPTYGRFNETQYDPEAPKILSVWQDVSERLDRAIADTRGRTERWKSNTGPVPLLDYVRGTPHDQLAEGCCHLLHDNKIPPSGSRTGRLNGLVRAIHFLAFGPAASVYGIDEAVKNAAKAFKERIQSSG